MGRPLSQWMYRVSRGPVALAALILFLAFTALGASFFLLLAGLILALWRRAVRAAPPHAGA